MVNENHHLTIDTQSAQVDTADSLSKSHHHHTHIEMDSHFRLQQQHQQQHRHHHHHHRLLNPEYHQEQLSRSRSRSPHNANTHRHGQENRHHPREALNDGVSPEALAQKLELLEAGQAHLQQRDPAELQRKNEEILQDIIERMDKTVSEQDPLDLDLSAETTILQEQSHQQLNPALLKDHYTLQQHHGNANIRHR